MTRRVSKKHNHSIKIKAKGERFFSGIDITGENLLGAPCSTRNLAKGGRSPVRARGSRSQQWYAESRAQMLRKKCRTQSLWNLHLAGDWHVGSETMPLGASSHMMRVMLISNLAVDQVSFWLSDPSLFHIREEPPALQRFANGTQGRLLQWHPAANESKRRALPAYCPDLLARFCKAGRSRGAHSWCRRHGG